MSGVMWNLWHGCQKISDGCANCYVYRSDDKHERDASIVYKTQKFSLPVKKKRNGEYSHPAGTLFWTCFTSDFLLDDADEWRKEAWQMIRQRSDCHFLFITKRIDRFLVNLPDDWGDGYDNVTVCCTCENQKQADLRLPVFKSLPVKHKVIIHEPLLSEIDIAKHLDETIEEVVVGGESGNNARPCNYSWVLKIRQDCINAGVSFTFKQTGANFLKDGRSYKIARNLQHVQARKAGINFCGSCKSYLGRDQHLQNEIVNSQPCLKLL